MKRIHVFASGEVQGVGYREEVKHIADELKIEEEFYGGEFSSFRVIRDKDIQKEILSALSKGTVDIHEMKEVLQGVKKDTSAMLEKQDLMLEKQDSLLEKQDTLLEVTERGFKEVKEEIHLQRDDFRELFMHEVSELRSEITEIKATLARMQAAG